MFDHRDDSRAIGHSRERQPHRDAGNTQLGGRPDMRSLPFNSSPLTDTLPRSGARRRRERPLAMPLASVTSAGSANAWWALSRPSRCAGDSDGSLSASTAMTALPPRSDWHRRRRRTSMSHGVGIGGGGGGSVDGVGGGGRICSERSCPSATRSCQYQEQCRPRSLGAG